MSGITDLRVPQNILAASVSFEFGAGSGDTHEFTATDNTVYPDGDSLAMATVTLADKFGKKAEYNIPSGETVVVVNLEGEGFNPVDGIDSLVTVASALGKVKDGSVFGVGVGKPTGNYIMEQ